MPASVSGGYFLFNAVKTPAPSPARYWGTIWAQPQTLPLKHTAKSMLEQAWIRCLIQSQLEFMFRLVQQLDRKQNAS